MPRRTRRLTYRAVVARRPLERVSDERPRAGPPPEPSRPGLEHHLVMISGRLRFTIDGRTHDLLPGDCLRYQLHGATAFEAGADEPARYFLFMV